MKQLSIKAMVCLADSQVGRFSTLTVTIYRDGYFTAHMMIKEIDTNGVSVVLAYSVNFILLTFIDKTRSFLPKITSPTIS